jgi:hypothetical protein
MAAAAAPTMMGDGFLDHSLILLITYYQSTTDILSAHLREVTSARLMPLLRTSARHQQCSNSRFFFIDAELDSLLVEHLKKLPS